MTNKMLFCTLFCQEKSRENLRDILMAQKSAVVSGGVAGYGESPAEWAAELGGGGGERESEGGRRCSLRCCSIHGDREKSHTTCYNGAR